MTHAMMLSWVERVQFTALAGVLTFGVLAFGGVVWWSRPLVVGFTLLLVLATLARIFLRGGWRPQRCPWLALGALAVLLALVQLLPLPGSLASRISGQAHALYAQGVLPGVVASDVTDPMIPPAATTRVPLSIDRGATARWIVNALVCLGLFWAVGQSTDRWRRLTMVWGLVIAVLGVNTVLGMVQVAGRVHGFYGAIMPGSASWTPSLADLATGPTDSVVRPAPGAPLVQPPGTQVWTVNQPRIPFLFGTLPESAGSYLALAALALPLTFTLLLHLIAPRGQRESLLIRLRFSGHTGVAALLLALFLGGCLLTGVLGGIALSAPILAAIVGIGVFSARPTGLRWLGGGVTLLGVLCLTLGWVWRDWGHWPPGTLADGGDATIMALWSHARAVAGEFRWFGCGLGGFAGVSGYYKWSDTTHMATTALAQWWVEAGVVGLILAAAGFAWACYRIPEVCSRVGRSDRVLVCGMIGVAVSFLGFSAIHWSIQLPAVALASSAFAGTLARFLAGGTDMFVEPIG